MPATQSSLIVILVALAILVMICRWVFSTGHRPDQPVRRTDTVRDYGLLVALTTARTREDAEMLRDVLADAGVRANISDDLEVLVFRVDLTRARQLVSAP